MGKDTMAIGFRCVDPAATLIWAVTLTEIGIQPSLEEFLHANAG
jgi:hypothetical protein